MLHRCALAVAAATLAVSPLAAEEARREPVPTSTATAPSTSRSKAT